MAKGKVVIDPVLWTAAELSLSLDAGNAWETAGASQSAHSGLCLSWHVLSVTGVSKNQRWFTCPV